MNILIEKNIMVPMRDGVRLATDVYRPADRGPVPVPVLLSRLPYNKELPTTFQAAIDTSRAVQAGYAVVLQDCRGRFGSEGEFTPMFNEASDGADTVAWIALQQWSTGQVGTVGASYLGFTQWLLARKQPEALRAMVPFITTSDYYQAPWRHTGGVFELGISLFWSVLMVPEELQRQLRQGKASMGQMGTLMSIALDIDQGPRDQRSVEAREDVLCYSTPILEKPVEVTGPIELVLFVSSSARDTDFTGKLVDVNPDGRAEILTDGILRARYRESFSEPKLLEPGQVYELHLDLWATSNVFKSGHRIRLEVTSSNFPRFDRNTNTGETIETETEKDFVQAVNRVYHDRTHPSHLILPIIERN